jgi:hypothetical protein
MAKKLVVYTLTDEGAIPDFIEDGGYLPNIDNGKTQILGVTKNEADISNAIVVFNNEKEAQNYVANYLLDEYEIDSSVFLTKDFVAELFSRTLV